MRDHACLNINAFTEECMEKTLRIGLCLCMCCFFVSPVFAEEENTEQRLKKLEDKVQDQQKEIETLKKGPDKQGNQDTTQGAKESTSWPAWKVSGLFGASALTNPNISLVLDTFVYSSNLTHNELINRGIPNFTTNGLDRRTGFDFREAELSIFAPVDPYVNLYANFPIDENGITVEEIYAVTTFLPWGFQVKGGKFKSNFSRLDAQHPHAWDFFDIPLPYRAFLGDEGLGGQKGVQLTYLPSLPIYTLIGIEGFQGENDVLFGNDAADGPHAVSAYMKFSMDASDNSTLYFGPSVLYGKTKNNNIIPGASVTASSTLYEMEAVWKWKPTNKQTLTIQGEYLLLTTEGGSATDLTTMAVDSLQRKQDGFYIQAMYRVNRWGFGARYDMLNVFTDTFKRAGVQQDSGTPWRETIAAEFNASEFTRIRLQLAHDRTDPHGRTNDEAILQFLFGIGAHAAHAF
jgi:hypothetical protein